MDLVTGGAGFIGSHLVARLVGLGRRVRVVDDLSTGDVSRLDAVRGEVEFVEGDLATVPLDGVLRGVERVFHLAAVPSVPRSVREPLVAHQSSATATLRLLVAARDTGAARFVLSSSSSVYGDAPGLPRRESMRPEPRSPYAVAKLAAEGYARVFADLHGMRTVTLRYFNVFGPRQDPFSSYAAVIPIFTARALAARALPIFGDGTQTRDFTFVDDAVEANLAAAAAEGVWGRVYNIAGGEPHSIFDLVAGLEAILGRSLAVEHLPERPGDVLHSHADISAARLELGWSPRVAFAEGLRRTVAWHVAQAMVKA